MVKKPFIKRTQLKQKHLYKSNTIKTRIEKIVFGGSGIASFEQMKVFVPYSAPGDIVQAKITERKRNYYVAEIKTMLEPSAMRTKPACPYFTDCGGCDFQHLKYEAQLQVKKESVLEVLSRIGHIRLSKPLSITPSVPFHYRNKSQYPLSSRPLSIGFFRPFSHHVIDIEKCLLHPPIFDDIRARIKELVIMTKELIYNEIKHSGNLRHIIIRQGMNTNEILLTFVTRTQHLESDLYKPLPSQFKNIVGMTQSINPERTNRILGNKSRTLFGHNYFYEKISGKRFKVSADAFFQVNTQQAENIAKKLRKYTGHTNRVLDLYCGVGMLSIMIHDLANELYGIEIDEQAIRDARENAKLNNITNIEYIAAPAELAIRNYKNIDTVILDPPRKGCNENLLKNIARIKPKQIIYISCNPTTFARDMTILDNLNYQLIDFELIDMFPQTFHVESIGKIIPK